MGDFELDTRVEPTGPTADGGALHRARLSRDWEIWGPNGGYLAAIALRAAGREAAIPRPACFSAHFLRVARFEDVEIEVRALRRGRRSESLAVGMWQGGERILEAMVRTAAPGDGLEHAHARMPDVPAPESLQPSEALRDPDQPRHRFWDNVEARPLDPEGFRGPWTAGDPVWREWYRLRPRATFDDPFTDAARSLMLIDTLGWPAAVRAHPEPDCTAPSLDVTAWFHDAAPDSAWLLADHESQVAGSGLIGTVGRIWSRDGRLIATGGSHLLCVPLPRDAAGH